MASAAFPLGSWCLRTASTLALVAGFLVVHTTAGRADGYSDAARPTCRGKAATIVGTPRDDDIVGTHKADVIVGGGGKDDIYGGGGSDTICGGAGPTRIEDGDEVFQTLSGGPGNDVIVGGPSPEWLVDSDGSDLLIGRGGNDFLAEEDRGGARDDDVLRGGAGADLLVGSRGADKLDGGAGEDRFQDALGDNVLRGGAGDDRFDSGQGNDTLVGGLGVDTGFYVVVLRSDGGSGGHCNDVTADLSTGLASGAGFGTDTLDGVENLASGGGDDVLIGDGYGNTFYVGMPCAGAPVQRDSATGGDGSDRIDFNSNTWDYGGSFGAVLVDLSAGTAEQRSPYVDTDAAVALDSIENATGTEFEDTILGSDDPNRLSAGPRYGNGGDVIRGRAGDDVLSGSDSRDEIYGDEGADHIRGYRGNDRLDGGADANIINGGRGKDTCASPDRFNGAVNCEA